MAYRGSITLRTRFQILERDGHTCQYCGARAPAVALEIDHIKPVALGGSSGLDNLITACRPCNQGKRAHPLTTTPAVFHVLTALRTRLGPDDDGTWTAGLISRAIALGHKAEWLLRDIDLYSSWEVFRETMETSITLSLEPPEHWLRPENEVLH